jgi:hypothetical protein
MRYPSLLGAVAITLWTIVGAGSQGGSAAVLTDSLRSHVKGDRFDVVTSIRGLPLGVRDALQALFGRDVLDIAEPGAAFRATDVVIDPKLPARRLSQSACSIDHCIVYYERGGIAHTWQVAIFHWTPAATRFEWGGSAPGGLRTIDDLRKAVLSGAIRASRSW